MSDTPETDKEFCEFAPTGDPRYEGPVEWVPAYFARRLERERDEARKNLEVSRDIVKNQSLLISELKEDLACIAKFRDALREENRKLRETVKKQSET